MVNHAVHEIRGLQDRRLEFLSSRSQHPGYGLRLGVDVQLAVDIADMGADGADADAVFVGDLFIAQSVDEGVEDLVLADGQLVVLMDGRRRGLKGLQDAAGDAGCHGRPALVEIANGLDDVFGRRTFEQIAGGARADGVEDILVVVEHGEHQDLDRREMGLDRPHTFDAGDIRQADVHEDDIGLGGAYFADDVEEVVEGDRTPHPFRPVEQAFQAAAQRGVVFDDADLYH